MSKEDKVLFEMVAKNYGSLRLDTFKGKHWIDLDENYFPLTKKRAEKLGKALLNIAEEM